MCKDVIVCCLTHGRGQNGGSSRGNPGLMLSHSSISSRLAHLHEFSRHGASRVQNFTWIDSPFLIFPKSNNSRGLISGIGSMGSAPTAKVTKRWFGSKESSSFYLPYFLLKTCLVNGH